MSPLYTLLALTHCRGLYLDGGDEPLGHDIDGKCLCDYRLIGIVCLERARRGGSCCHHPNGVVTAITLLFIVFGAICTC